MEGLQKTRSRRAESRFLAWVLTFAMIFSLLPSTTVSALAAQTGDGLEISLTATDEVEGYVGENQMILFTATYDGQTVTDAELYSAVSSDESVVYVDVDQQRYYFTGAGTTTVKLTFSYEYDILRDPVYVESLVNVTVYEKEVEEEEDIYFFMKSYDLTVGDTKVLTAYADSACSKS